jgi:hypothetical protein
VITPPPMICKLIKAGQQARLLAHYITSKSTRVVADLGYGEVEMTRDDWRWAGDQLRADHADSRASEVRHVVFSGSRNLALDQARQTLYRTALDWLSTYAPARRWLMGFQQHNGVEHLHLAVGNVGEDGRPLDLDPYAVVAMSRMKFTTHAVSAKGRGVGRGTGKVYSKSRKSSARDLAEALAPAVRTGAALDHLLISHPGVCAPRHRKDGSLISFEFDGKRIKLATVLGFISQTAQAKGGENDNGYPTLKRSRHDRALLRNRHRLRNVVQRMARVH